MVSSAPTIWIIILWFLIVFVTWVFSNKLDKLEMKIKEIESELKGGIKKDVR